MEMGSGTSIGSKRQNKTMEVGVSGAGSSINALTSEVKSLKEKVLFSHILLYYISFWLLGTGLVDVFLRLNIDWSFLF